MKKMIWTLIVLCTFSCSKQQEKKEAPAKATTEVRNARAAHRSADEDNYRPEYFDFVGQAHNDALDYVFDHVFASNNDPHYSDVKTSVLDYFQRVYEPTVNIKNDSLGPDFDHIVKAAVTTRSILGDRPALLDVSEEQMSILQELDGIFNGRLSVAAKIESIYALDEKILRLVPEDEQTYLIMANSVARHSLEYWNGPSADKWYKKFDVDENRGAKIQWRDVAVADVTAFLYNFPRGAARGALIGAISLGIETGGIGALPGLIVGAVGGGFASGITAAVAASGCALAAEAIFSWWD